MFWLKIRKNEYQIIILIDLLSSLLIIFRFAIVNVLEILLPSDTLYLAVFDLRFFLSTLSKFFVLTVVYDSFLYL